MAYTYTTTSGTVSTRVQPPACPPIGAVAVNPLRQAIGELLVQRPGIGETWLEKGDGFTCTRNRTYIWNGAALVEQEGSVPQGLTDYMTKQEVEGYYQKKYNALLADRGITGIQEMERLKQENAKNLVDKAQALEKLEEMEQELALANRDLAQYRTGFDAVRLGQDHLRKELAAKEAEIAKLKEMNNNQASMLSKASGWMYEPRPMGGFKRFIEKDQPVTEGVFTEQELERILKRTLEGWKTKEQVKEMESVGNKKVYTAAVVNVETDMATLLAVVAESAEDARLAAALQAGISLDDFRTKYEVVLVTGVGITKQPKAAAGGSQSS